MRIALTLAMLALALSAYAAGHAVQVKGMKFNPAKNVAVGDLSPSPTATSDAIHKAACHGREHHREDRRRWQVRFKMYVSPLDDRHCHREIAHFLRQAVSD